ncbi:hypothetical protein SCHPADRAFT_889817 [Schizopora paradoxa]|uniref:Uncharacterized protein n=1 Tax=Schizopora paradoxa TaxID=27342 RepID=A0A0H2SA13_9AGAM|nr:hypothetical protein SCHPADRAFT_889817 [Schizopora paradoxa]
MLLEPEQVKPAFIVNYVNGGSRSMPLLDHETNVVTRNFIYLMNSSVLCDVAGMHHAPQLRGPLEGSDTWNTFQIYDACLKFEDEDWTFLKCVYIGSKYLAFVDGALTLVLLLRPGLQPHSCGVLYKTALYVIWFGVLLAEVYHASRFSLLTVKLSLKFWFSLH